MKVRRLRTLTLETFKTLNGLNPTFMKNLFATRELLPSINKMKIK